MSHLAWLDTSESDRRRMMHVIDLFQQKGTVDELGLGGIRDTISDVLTPGTSTIQTRARYFFFIPWIYLSLERKGTAAERVATKARSLEIELSAALSQSSDSAGTIGLLAGASLKRLASSVYWAGLKRLGFRLFDGAQERYHRRFGKPLQIVSEEPSEQTLSANWNPHLPEPPEGFPEAMSLALTKDEASFFAEQLAMHAQNSLLQFLVDRKEIGEGIRFPWELSTIGEMSPDLRLWLNHARCYSELMYGAALLYNLMLAEKGKRDELHESYGAAFDQWAELIEARRGPLACWPRGEFWSSVRRENPRTSVPAEQFSNQWIDAVMASKSASALRDDKVARRWIEEREYRLKTSRARLRSPAHLELWGGASGADQFNYRWGITQSIVRDIVAGLAA
jgi:hypothetical protein